MVGDKNVEAKRRLIVRVEIRPVHGDDNRLPRANNFRHPGSEHVPYDDALIAQQPVDLLDGVFAQQSTRLGQGLADDRHRQRLARHDADGAIGKRHHALGVNIFGEYAVEIFANKLNTLDRMIYGCVSLRPDCPAPSFAMKFGQ